MAQISTAQTLAALKAIAALEYHPLGRTDRLMYEGAADDALAATGEDASLLRDLTSAALEIGEGTMDVVISGSRVELHACTESGDPFALTLDLDLVDL